MISRELKKRIITSLALLTILILMFLYSYILIISLIIFSIISWIEFYGLIPRILVKNKFKSIRIAYGGMAAIPQRATYCEKILLNSVVTKEIIHKAKKALEKDFKPISDMRASELYRMEVAKNLLEKFCAEIKQKKLIGIYF